MRHNNTEFCGCQEHQKASGIDALQIRLERSERRARFWVLLAGIGIGAALTCLYVLWLIAHVPGVYA